MYHVVVKIVLLKLEK